MNEKGAIIHIVDDDGSYRTAVGRLIEASGFGWVGYGSGVEFLARLPAPGPGCVLLDLRMPGVDGLELQGSLAKTLPLLPVIFLTGQGDIVSSVSAMKAGAEDFLEKSASPDMLLAAIERGVALYRSRLSDHERTTGLRARVASLTPRENLVFGLIVKGKRNKQIAHVLGTTERTVKAHRHNVMEKLGAHSFAEVVSIAERLGLVEETTPPLA